MGQLRQASIASTRDVAMTSAPLAFTFGLGAGFLFPAARRGGLRDHRAAEPAGDARSDRAVRVTHLATAPTAYKAMLSQRARRGRSRPSATACRPASICPTLTWHAWRDRTGIAITDGIGLDRDDAHLHLRAGGDIRPGATGKAVPGVRSDRVDDAGSRWARAPSAGVKGPTGCRYLDDPRQRDYLRRLERHRDTYRRHPTAITVPRALRRHDRHSGYNIGAPEWRMLCCRTRGRRVAVTECRARSAGRRSCVRGGVLRSGTVGRAVPSSRPHAKAQIAPTNPRARSSLWRRAQDATGKLRRSELRCPITYHTPQSPDRPRGCRRLWRASP